MTKPQITSKREVLIKATEEDEQLVFGEVYVPDVPDSQGDHMTRQTIQKMAHDFLKAGRVTKIDVQHDQVDSGCLVVESFIARDDDSIFIPGSWVIGVWVTDDIWPLVKSGELNGFSLDGYGYRVEDEVTLLIPDGMLKGETEVEDDHEHEFIVTYSPTGQFLGGITTAAEDGHWHVIKSGTITEDAVGGPQGKSHHHKFSFVEGVTVVEADD